MDWTEVTHPEQIKMIVEGSAEKPVLLFKHSTRCSISTTAKHRLERNIAQLTEVMDMYLVNVIRNRDVSNAIASEFSVQHESPQALIFVDGQCVYYASHLSIDAASLIDATEK